MLIAPTSIMLVASMVLPLPTAIAIAPLAAAAAAAHVAAAAAPRRLDAPLTEVGGTMRAHACKLQAV